jgi:branched-chain amino acid transport system ATP-binding protein
MLALGRALVGGPKFLLLGEHSMRLAPPRREASDGNHRSGEGAGTTVLLGEQNAGAALRIADSAYVLESGAVTMSGPAAELAADPRVVEA